MKDEIQGEIEREYNNTVVSGKELPGEWIVEYVMKGSSGIWLAVVREKNADSHESVQLTRFRKAHNFSVGQRVKVLQSTYRPDFFISLKE